MPQVRMRVPEVSAGQKLPKLPSPRFLKAPQTLPRKSSSGLNPAWDVAWPGGGTSSWAETEKHLKVQTAPVWLYTWRPCSREQRCPGARATEVLSDGLAKLDGLRFQPCLGSPGHTKSSISGRGPQSISAFKASNKTLKLCRQCLELRSKGSV